MILMQNQNNQQERGKLRNVTPSFVRFKPPSTERGAGVQAPSHERCPSRTSRSSLEAYQRRILQLSQLKKRITPSKADEIKESRPPSNQRTISNEKGSHNGSVSKRPQIFHKLGVDKRKNSSSNKNLLAGPKTNRTPSAERRTEDSLHKEEARAERMNLQLMQNIAKNQPVTNYLQKLKMKKIQTKKTAKPRLLNLTVPVFGAEELQKYDIYGNLGQGAYGIVKMGLEKQTGERVAIKLYQKKRIDEPNKLKNLQRQINLLGEMSHPTIAKLLQVIETQTQIYIIMEYGGANSLYQYILSKKDHRLEEAEAKRILLTIADALCYLHRKNVVHRDIKAENILINRHRQLKLIDFGFSLRCAPNETIDTFCGTPTYMAPEIVSKIDHCPVYTDMWSLGVLFYVMLQGNYPFRAKEENELFQKIRLGEFQYIHSDISLESRRMIECLLKVKPLDRLTIQQLLSKSNRQWLSTNVE